jgi:hypothetical protein
MKWRRTQWADVYCFEIICHHSKTPRDSNLHIHRHVGMANRTAASPACLQVWHADAALENPRPKRLGIGAEGIQCETKKIHENHVFMNGI